jgi:phosphonate transport system substrate-binding protein
MKVHKKIVNSLLIFLMLMAWGTAAMAAEQSVLLGISEGLAEQASFSDLQDKYRPFADYLGQVVKRKVIFESSQNIKSAAANLQKGRYDLMYVRPANLAAKAIRDNNYKLVAMAKGEFVAAFIVSNDSPLKKPEDVLNKKIALPEKGSLMANVGLATLRDMGGTRQDLLHFTHYQEAIGFMLDQHFADVGIVAPIMVKAWEKKGGRVLFESKKLPFWCVIAGPQISDGDVAKLRDALLNMENSDEGKKILQRIGVKGWVPGDQQQYVEMVNWLSKGS